MCYISLSSPSTIVLQSKDGYTPYGPPYIENSKLTKKLLSEVIQNRSSKIHKLLCAKIDPNVSKSESGNYPLHYAAQFGNARTVKKLILAGADIDKRNSMGQTPLMVASRSTRGRSAACIKLFLRHDPNCINAVDNDGGTALQQAILSLNKKAVKLLIQNGADLNWEEKMIVFQRKEDLSVAVALAKGVKDIIWGRDLAGICLSHRRVSPRTKPFLFWRKMTMRQLYMSNKILKLLDSATRNAMDEGRET